MQEVSVLVLTYNHENYIEKCLKSILNQSFPCKFPIYVVDDCSTDKTIDILIALDRSYPGRIKLIVNEYNYVSRCEAPAKKTMSLIQSKFLAFCDGDDFWIDKDKLQKQVNMLNHDASLSLCHTNYLMGTEDAGIMKTRTRSLDEVLQSKSQRKVSDLLTGTHIKQSTVLVRREYIDLEFVYSSKYIPGLDSLIYLSAGMRGNFAFLEDLTTVHRIHGSNLFNNSTRNYRDNLKKEFRWYCAANLPPGELRNSFQRQVFEMEFRKKIRNLPGYTLLSPIVGYFRQARNFLKRL
jgi:glycosyltransferase involved in cell wall biosynthesis